MHSGRSRDFDDTYFVLIQHTLSVPTLYKSNFFAKARWILRCQVQQVHTVAAIVVLKKLSVLCQDSVCLYKVIEGRTYAHRAVPKSAATQLSRDGRFFKSF